MNQATIRLGYVGFRGNLAEWYRFGTEIFGFQAIDEGSTLRFRLDNRAWRILVESGLPGCAFIGLEVDTDATLDAIAARLVAAGYEAIEDKPLAISRQVVRLIRTVAPDGSVIELFKGAMTVSEPFVSPRGARFVTGEGGLGHVLLLVPDIERALYFFEAILGLQRTDSIVVAPGADGHFLNGGCRHHIVALAMLPGVSGFDHLYVEVDDMTAVGRAWDLVQGGAAPVARSLGQHANDPAFSFYTETPSGCLLEYGCGSTFVPDRSSWVQTRWESAYLWGGTFGTRKIQ